MSFIFLPVFLELGSYSRETTGLFGGEPFELLFTLRSIFEHYLIGNMKTISVINRTAINSPPAICSASTEFSISSSFLHL